MGKKEPKIYEVWIFLPSLGSDAPVKLELNKKDLSVLLRRYQKYGYYFLHAVGSETVRVYPGKGCIEV